MPLQRVPLVPPLSLIFSFNFFPLFFLISRSENLRLLLASNRLRGFVWCEVFLGGRGMGCPAFQSDQDCT